MDKSDRAKSEGRDLTDKALETIRRRIDAGGAPSTVMFNDHPASHGVSEALRELVDPYVSEEMTLDEWPEVLTMGMVGWNSAVLPDGEWQSYLRTVVESAPDADMKPQLYEAIENIRQRKLQLFPDDLRQIVDRQVWQQDGQFHCMVAVQVPGLNVPGTGAPADSATD
jgi:hypothetical protein